MQAAPRERLMVKAIIVAALPVLMQIGTATLLCAAPASEQQASMQVDGRSLKDTPDSDLVGALHDPATNEDLRRSIRAEIALRCTWRGRVGYGQNR